MNKQQYQVRLTLADDDIKVIEEVQAYVRTYKPSKTTPTKMKGYDLFDKGKLCLHESIAHSYKNDDSQRTSVQRRKSLAR